MLGEPRRERPDVQAKDGPPPLQPVRALRQVGDRFRSLGVEPPHGDPPARSRHDEGLTGPNLGRSDHHAFVSSPTESEPVAGTVFLVADVARPFQVGHGRRFIAPEPGSGNIEGDRKRLQDNGGQRRHPVHQNRQCAGIPPSAFEIFLDHVRAPDDLNFRGSAFGPVKPEADVRIRERDGARLRPEITVNGKQERRL